MADLSRRNLLPFAAAALASAAAAVPVIANPADGPDAELLDLIRRCNEAMDESDAFQPTLQAAEARYDRPPLPQAVYARETDTFPAYIMRQDWLATDRGEPTGPLSYDNTAAAKYFSVIYDHAAPAERERINEIVAAQMHWKTEKTARWNAAGLPGVYAESERLSDIGSELRYEICHTPATTMAGLVAKAAIVARCFGPEETFADYCADLLADPPSFNREQAIAELNGRIADFYVRHLVGKP